MASKGFVAITAILVLGLVLPNFQVVGQFNPDGAMEQAKAVATGKGGPDVKTFNVLDYGAKSDGMTPSSINFIRAFKAACNSPGKAMMVIPEGSFVVGSILFSGPCRCKAPLMVRVSGTVLPQGNTVTAEGAEWITFQSIDGLIVSGEGTFDGRGEKAWKSKCKGCKRLPASLKFMKVNDAIISGIQSVNPKGFHFSINICENIRVDDINIKAPADSPNTDGIHISKTSNVIISNSRIATGDDCVGIIQGSSNITIKNINCGPGHGISIGSLGHYDSEDDVSGITVKNCTLTGTDNGARIKTYKNDHPSKASGIIFEDLKMNNVKNPILIDQEYGKKGGSKSSKVSIQNVKFSNIKGTSASKVAVDLTCSKSTPCKAISLKNIDLRFKGTEEAKTPFSSNCVNVKVTYSGVQNPPPCPP